MRDFARELDALSTYNTCLLRISEELSKRREEGVDVDDGRSYFIPPKPLK